MRKFLNSLIVLAACAGATPAFAQEVLVSAQRHGAANYEPGYNGAIVPSQRPIITLKRSADYVVQTVRIVGDTRDLTERVKEVNATIRNAIAGESKGGVELATGDYVLERLTMANYLKLNFTSDGRPDTAVATFLVKVKLTSGMDMAAASKAIDAYVKSVAKVGRTTFATSGDPTLSVVNPDQYRGAIVDLIAADAAVQAGKFGAGYGVDVTGLDRPVEWARAGPTDVFLYLPSAYTVTKH